MIMEEKKLSFFAHNTIIHVENPESIKEISLAVLQGGWPTHKTELRHLCVV